MKRLHDVVSTMGNVKLERYAAFEYQVGGVGVPALFEYLLSAAVFDLFGRGGEYDHLLGTEPLEEGLLT